MRPARSVEVLSHVEQLGSKLQDGILLKISVPSDSSLHKSRTNLGSESSTNRKNFLTLPGEEEERSHRRHSVQSERNQRKGSFSEADRKKHDRKSSFPEAELLGEVRKHHRRKSATPSPNGSVANLGRRRSSSRDSGGRLSPSRRSSNSSGDHSRRSSKSEDRLHHHNRRESRSETRRESCVGPQHGGHHRRSRCDSAVSVRGLPRNSFGREPGKGGTGDDEEEDDPNDPATRRRKVIILVIGSAFIFILLMSVLLVAVTLTLSPRIDEMGEYTVT